MFAAMQGGFEKHVVDLLRTMRGRDQHRAAHSERPASSACWLAASRRASPISMRAGFTRR